MRPSIQCHTLCCPWIESMLVWYLWVTCLIIAEIFNHRSCSLRFFWVEWSDVTALTFDWDVVCRMISKPSISVIAGLHVCIVSAWSHCCAYSLSGVLPFATVICPGTWTRWLCVHTLLLQCTHANNLDRWSTVKAVERLSRMFARSVPMYNYWGRQGLC